MRFATVSLSNIPSLASNKTADGVRNQNLTEMPTLRRVTIQAYEYYLSVFLAIAITDNLLYGSREKYIRVELRYPPFWGPEARFMLNWFETKSSLRLTGLTFWKSFV